MKAPIDSPQSFRPQTAPPRSASPAAPSSVLGLMILVAALSASLGSTVTYIVLTRSSPASLETKAAVAKKPPAPKIARNTSGSPVPKSAADTSDDLPEAPDAAPFSPQIIKAASAALNLIQTVRDANYVKPRPGTHWGLYNNMATLEKAANAVLNDDGTDAATSANLVNALSAAFNATSGNAHSIGTNARETDTSKADALQIEENLRALKSQFVQ